MLEFKAKTNEGIPFLCQDESGDGWSAAVIYSARRSTDSPYLAHLMTPSNEEISFSVSRDSASTRLTLVNIKGKAPASKVDWLMEIVTQYDNVLEGLGE